jgi:hypothetical protein
MEYCFISLTYMSFFFLCLCVPTDVETCVDANVDDDNNVDVETGVVVWVEVQVGYNKGVLFLNLAFVSIHSILGFCILASYVKQCLILCINHNMQGVISSEYFWE